jgi:dienelactone hydrolase
MILSLPRKLVVLGAATALMAGAAGVATATPTRGELLSVTPISALSRDQVAGLLEPAGIDTRVVRHGVDAYRLEYRTVDLHGRRTKASGTVALPRTGGRTLPTVVFQHGTIAAKADAGSVGPDTNRIAPITFATAGNAVIAPDYLGLGTGPGTHPYGDLRSTTTASLDLLRAAGEFSDRLDRRVRLTGFSQGGPAAMALAEELQRGGRLAAVAGISGFYDLFGTQFPEALAGTVVPKLATISSAYFLVSMQRLGRAPGDLFKVPGVADLFDGHHSGAEIAAALPNTPHDLLTEQAIHLLENPTPVLRRTTDGSCLGWKPRVPVRLYTATGGDELVPIGNSTHCRDAFAARGVDVPLTEVGRVGHNASAALSYPLIIDFFAEIGG